MVKQGWWGGGVQKGSNGKPLTVLSKSRCLDPVTQRAAGSGHLSEKQQPLTADCEGAQLSHLTFSPNPSSFPYNTAEEWQET